MQHPDATACAELVRSGAVSPRELVDDAIGRIQRDNAELGLVNIELFDSARATAAAYTQTPSTAPFHGVPILIKDLGATVAGVLQTGGVLPLKQAPNLAAHDSHLVARLRAAGFIIVGKTTTSEFGILPSSEPPAWPPARNPYDPTRSTGGSSGGSAGAVAAGFVPLAHASDGGGSIRIPASCCGLFGLKPSRGRVSFAPDIGDLNGGLVNEHVVTRTVRDSAAVLDLLCGAVAGDPYAAPPPARPYLDELRAPPAPLKIGFATRHVDLEGRLVEAHPDCVAAVAHTATLLAALGHHVEPAEIETLFEPEWVPRFLSIWVAGVAHNLDELGRVLGRPAEERDVELLTWSLGQLGNLISASGYIDAWRWIHGAARRIAKFWDRYDLWLTPTVSTPPKPLGTFRSPPDDPLAGIFRAAEFAPFTPPFNATGQPAVSLPLYRNAAGLPIGTQLVAAMNREDLLFAISAQLEAAQPFVHAALR